MKTIVRTLCALSIVSNILGQIAPGPAPTAAQLAKYDALSHKNSELEAALKQARAAERTSVIVIDTDPLASTQAGGHWWDVAVPEVSERAEVRAARAAYETALKAQRLGD